MESWADMLDYEPEVISEAGQENVDDVTIQELPPSPRDGRDVNTNEDCDDVLDLHGNESEYSLSDVADCKTVPRFPLRETETGVPPSLTNKAKRFERERATIPRRCKQRRAVNHPSKVHKNRAVLGGVGETEYCSVQRQQQETVGSGPAIPLQEHARNPRNNRWAVRWVRAGYETLLYDICKCNESPNVIFTTLCYRQSDVFAMVLKNCNCKRRYWYDQRSKRRRTQIVRDFERAMLWRANTIGRSWSSPGYDLASFVLQHVAADRRCSERREATPLILVTTDEMLDDPSIGEQLVYRQRTRTCLPEMCAVCRAPAGIVTQDNASTPMFTCWEHSSSQLANYSADRTRVCDTIIADMQFLHCRENNEYVCRLSVIVSEQPTTSHVRVHNGTRKITVAEIVLLPADADIADDGEETWVNGTRQTTEQVMDLDRIHSTCCQDMHENQEDLFPSMPTGNGTLGSVVKYYDTTIGRTLDKVYCITNKLQK